MAYFGQVKQLEDTIIKTQQELSKIMLEYHISGEDNAVLELQIKHCKENLQVLERQIAELESRLGKDAEQPAISVNVSKPIEVQSKKNVTPMIVPEPVNEVPSQPLARSVKQKEKKNMETMLGKSGMGIMASGLIFISFILFATLLYTQLTDIIKMVSLFVLSGAFLGIGLWKLKGKDNHPLWSSVTGCGIGGFYIALFLSNLYFHAINDIVLYGCLLVWCIGVCVLAKRKSVIFQIIGYIGILISVYAGTSLCNARDDITMMFFLVIYTIVALLIFQISHWDKDEYYKNWMSIAAQLLSSVALVVLNGTQFWIGDFLILIYLAIQIGYVLFRVNPEKKSFVAGISLVCNIYLLGYVAYNDLAPLGLACQLVEVLVVLLVFHLLVERMKWNREDVTYRVLIAIFTIGYVVFAYGAGSSELKWQVPIICFALVYLLVAYFFNAKYYKWLSAFLALAFVPSFNLNGFLYLGLSIAFMVVFYVLQYRKAEEYEAVASYVWYLTSQLLLAVGLASVFSFFPEVDFVVASLIILTVDGLFNFIVLTSKWFYNPITKMRDEKMYGLAVGINNIFMLCTWAFVAFEHNPFFILLAALFFSTLTRQELAKNRFSISLWVGAKYTLLLIAVMLHFDVSGAPVSLAFFVIAIISIVFGFALRQPGLRIYGLVLSLISVVKLVMIDIDYGNAVARAASFFVCGVLCFVISFIYNMVDKKVKKQVPED